VQQKQITMSADDVASTSALETKETVDGSLSSSHDSIELKIAEKNKSRVDFADIDVSIIPPTVEPSRCSAPGSSIMANRHSMASFWSLSWSRLNHSGSGRSETSLRKSILSYVQSIWDGRLFKFTDLPEWMRDNEYITDMHRPQIKNLRSCIRSIFSIHAETGNIWTHLIGALIFLGLIINYILKPNDDFVNSTNEKFVTITFYVSAFLCLSFSTTFHALAPNSAETCLFCGRLDYTGIAILITGSFLPWVFYSFYCEAQTQVVYISSIFILGTFITLVSITKEFALPKYRVLRGLLFFIFGACGIAPCVHSTIYHGVEYSFGEGQMQNLILMGALYAVGVALFVTRFPESVWPGKFNLIFQSHQLFHVLVVSAALVQVYAISVLQKNRFISGDSCDTSNDSQ
jgi:adiponectin receptor